MAYRAYFEIPQTNKKHFKGSAPNLLMNLVEEIRGAVEIKLSFFLYNNPYLHSKLEELANLGCKITIFSIPLNGYDLKRVLIFKNNYRDSFWSSKKEYAEKIYKRIEAGIPNFELKIFPHTYIWVRQKFSRGKELYSLHNKSILAKFPDGRTKCISSSCNFAFGDPKHSENYLLVGDDRNTVLMFETYFQLLEQHSLSQEEYGAFSDRSYDFEYIVEPTNLQDRFHTCYFTAPFIKYENMGSNHYVQKKIIDFIKTAKQRIYTCSQHFSDYESFDPCAQSIIKAISEVATEKQIELKILKQTRQRHQKQGARTTSAEKLFKQIRNAEQRYLSPIIHDKFIVVDNKILITTANFTSTQFAWAEDHNMAYFVVSENKNYIIQNTFSEINSFHFVEDIDLVNGYVSHFNNLWRMANVII
ncbi:phospholipase D-like domain-containing protein [Anoxybacteroides rupiense]|uniref:phospholipase D-like domain-containing protein n=1 Tax=Anoxybacteroides rupiense TaxID=311460 RepID=UPI00366E7B66